MSQANSEISVSDFAVLRDKQTPHTLLDVREANELLICSLPDSLDIRMNDVPSNLQNLPKDQPLIVLCHHGIRSRMVVNFLLQQGFENALNLTGGIEQWAQSIDPDMRRY